MAERYFPSSFVHEDERYIVSGYSKKGEKHNYPGGENEDTSLYVPEYGLALIGDGSSSTKGAKTASEAAVSYLADRLGREQTCVSTTRRLMRDAIGDANRYVQQRAPGARTTIVVLQLVQARKKEVAVFGNLGDSRGVLQRNGKFKFTTRDHNLLTGFRGSLYEKKRIQKIIDTLQDRDVYRGLRKTDQNAWFFFDNRNWVYEILGKNGTLVPEGMEKYFVTSETNNPHMSQVAIEPGDILGVISDGVHDPLVTDDISYPLVNSKRRNLAMSLVMRSYAPSARFRMEEEDDSTAIIFQRKR